MCDCRRTSTKWEKLLSVATGHFTLICKHLFWKITPLKCGFVVLGLLKSHLVAFYTADVIIL